MNDDLGTGDDWRAIGAWLLCWSSRRILPLTAAYIVRARYLRRLLLVQALNKWFAVQRKRAP